MVAFEIWEFLRSTDGFLQTQIDKEAVENEVKKVNSDLF